MKKLLYIFIFILLFIELGAQDARKDYNVLTGKIINSDTLPHIQIEEVYVFPEISENNVWNKWKYRRLIKNIKVVYPYAKYARHKFQEMDNYYKSLKTAKEKRQYINNLEEEILTEFEDDLRKLTLSQGRLLLKLIDRETGHSSFEILKEYKGSLSAFFWQALAKIFGSNLKSEYDPTGKDKIIEELIFLYERGLL